MQVVLSVEVVMDKMVAKSFHIGTAARFAGAISVGCSEVSWVLACSMPQPWIWKHKKGGYMSLTNYVCNCTFVLQHFDLPKLARGLGESNVVESMRPNLMAFGYHTSDKVEPFLGRVNLSLAVVVASDKEGCFGIVGCKEI